MDRTECRDFPKLAMLEGEIAEKEKTIENMERSNDELLREVRRLRYLIRSMEDHEPEEHDS